jgi:hypothetical protein
MAYVKTTWVEGITGISAVKLNNIEDGIEDVDLELTAHIVLVEHPAGRIYAYKNLGGAL